MRKHRSSRQAQIALTLNCAHEAHGIDVEKPAPWVHRHYARLEQKEDQNGAMILQTDGCLVGAGSEWHPKTGFPSPEEDVLLHLVLMGTRNNRAIFGERDQPFRRMTLELLSSTAAHLQLQSVHLANASQHSDDGNLTEAVLTSAVTLASHMNGINGIDFNPFLKHLVFELCLGTPKFENIALDGQAMLNNFAHIRMPYLGAPNTVFPQELMLLLPALANQRRTVNKEMVDGYFEWQNTGNRTMACYLEGKFRSRVVDLAVMKKILKVPEKRREKHMPECDIAFILTTKLQGKYFTKAKKESWAHFRQTHGLNDYLILKMKVDETQFNSAVGRISLIGGMDCEITAEGPKKLMMFIECPMKDSEVDALQEFEPPSQNQ